MPPVCLACTLDGTTKNDDGPGPSPTACRESRGTHFDCEENQSAAQTAPTHPRCGLRSVLHERDQPGRHRYDPGQSQAVPRPAFTATSILRPIWRSHFSTDARSCGHAPGSRPRSNAARRIQKRGCWPSSTSSTAGFTRTRSRAARSSMRCWRRKRTAQCAKRPSFIWRRSAPSSKVWRRKRTFRTRKSSRKFGIC